MFELLTSFFLMASTFTSSIIPGLPINKSNSAIIKKVVIKSTPAPLKSGHDPELQKMEMEVLALEKELKNITLYPTSIKSGQAPNILSSVHRAPAEDKILIPTSNLPTAGTLTPIKSERAPKPTLKPTSTPTPGSPDTPIVTAKPSEKIKVQSGQAPKPTSTPTPTPFPIPTITKQAAPVNGLNANELFAMVNNYRSTFDLPPFKKDEAVCAIAQNRAPEVYNEIYGNSAMHSGLRAMNLPYYVNENIINFTTEQHAFNWWINDKIHRDAILADYTYSCIACHAHNCSEIFTSYIPK